MSKFLENVLQAIRTLAGTTEEKISKLENLLAMTPGKERRARGKIEVLLEEMRGLRDGGIRYKVWLGKKAPKASFVVLTTKSLRGNPTITIDGTFYRVCRVKQGNIHVKPYQPIACTTVKEHHE